MKLREMKKKKKPRKWKWKSSNHKFIIKRKEYYPENIRCREVKSKAQNVRLRRKKKKKKKNQNFGHYEDEKEKKKKNWEVCMRGAVWQREVCACVSLSWVLSEVSERVTEWGIEWLWDESEARTLRRGVRLWLWEC